MSRLRGTFESIVSASDAQSAIDIAAEALPKGADITGSDAQDVSEEFGKDSWLVTIKFKRQAPEADY
ncbi:MAG: hypothetical protein AB7O49_07670 [Sphingomonadales bacterium]